MKRTASTLLTTTSLALANLAMPIKAMAAGIINPVTGNLGNDPAKAKSGALFTSYFINLWRVMISVGSILVMVFFLWGAIEWITSGGDKSKTEIARNRITNAVIGLIILVSSFTLVGFIGKLFFGTDFDILKITIPTPATTP